MKVLVLFTLPPDGTKAGRSASEFDLAEGVRSVADVIPGSVIAGIRGRPDEILGVLKQHRPDVVFNACEAPLGRPDLEAHVAALLEWVQIPFTGAGSATLELCRRKDRTKAVLSASGITVPRGGVLPCIVKPASEDGSAGIDGDSICSTEVEVLRSIRRIGAPVVAEEFIAGREFAVSLWGQREGDWASIGETRFSGDLRLNTYAGKWDPASPNFANSPMVYDHQLESSLREAIVKTARAAWDAVGLRGYARIDIRLNASVVPCVLEVNPNPDLSPGAGIHRGIIETGWTWERFIRKQIEWALSSGSY
jgi:D-alanine-D-alanine ligase